MMGFTIQVCCILMIIVDTSTSVKDGKLHKKKLFLFPYYRFFTNFLAFVKVNINFDCEMIKKKHYVFLWFCNEIILWRQIVITYILIHAQVTWIYCCICISAVLTTLVVVVLLLYFGMKKDYFYLYEYYK